MIIGKILNQNYHICLMIKKIIVLLFLLNSYFGHAHQGHELSRLAEISIITSGPGTSFYEKFGHAAIRIKSPMLHLDLIYNYGIFDFNGPNFYLNFTRGFMKYKLSRYPFRYAIESAKQDGRWMKEQILNLTVEEKNDLFELLEINASPKNASYFYDPFFDNCATKPRDIINKILGQKVIWSDDFTTNESFRELMNQKIHQNTWGSLGINIALGSKLDRKAKATEYLYLPDYLAKALVLAKVKKNEKEEKLVKETNILLNFEEKPSKSNLVNPFLVFFLLFIVGGYITFKDYKKQQRTKWLDFILFLFTGLIGFLIVFLWFFTNHSTAPNNFNALWAFPANLIIGLYLLKKKPPIWIGKYIRFLLILLVFIPIIWLTKIQLFNWTLLPLFLLLILRYLFLQKTLNS